MNVKDKNFTAYHKAHEYLTSLANVANRDYMRDRQHTTFYLKRMEYFLDLLGHPERGMKYIHITGTSGKGTISATVAEALWRSGKKVGLYTSPYVSSAIENIKVNDTYIAPGAFAAYMEQCKPLVDKAYRDAPYGGPSYTELKTAIALLYFRDMKCEHVVLEVGCGGRYDSTNIIAKPQVTAITNIDYDHIELLGPTLKNIAWNKAGILKRGSAFFTTETRPAIRSYLVTLAKKVGAKYMPLPVTQEYKKANRMLVEAICAYIGLPEIKVKEAIEKCRLPGRFETMQKSPLVVLDGAHNRAKILTTVENVKKLKYKKLHLVFGMKQGKNPLHTLAPLLSLADHVYLTQLGSGHKAANPRELYQLSKKYKKKTMTLEMFLDPGQALDKAMKNATKGDLILVTGSFYLIGELRKRWYSEEYVLKNRKSF